MAEPDSAPNAPLGHADLALATPGLPPRDTSPPTSIPVLSASWVPVASAGYPTIKLAHAVVITEAPPAYVTLRSKTKQELRTFASHDDKIDAIRDHGYAAGKALSTADIECALQASNGDVHVALQAQSPRVQAFLVKCWANRAATESFNSATIGLRPSVARSVCARGIAGSALPCAYARYINTNIKFYYK